MPAGSRRRRTRASRTPADGAPAGQLAAGAHLAQPALGRVPGRGRRHHDAARRRAAAPCAGVGTNASPSRITRVTLAPRRQPQLEHLDAVQPRSAGPDPDGDDVGVERAERGALDVEVDGASPTPRAAAGAPAQGSVGPCTRVKTTTSTNTTSKTCVAPRHPAGQRDGREHDRHGAAQPGPGQERLLAPRARRNHETLASTASGRASSTQHQAERERGQDLAGQPGGVGQQPEQHEQADLGDPAQRLGETADGGRRAAGARCPGPARRGTRRGSPSRAGRRGPVRRDGQAEHRDRVEAGRRQGHAAQQQGAGQPDRQADRRADGQLEHRLAEQHATTGAPGRRRPARSARPRG